MQDHLRKALFLFNVVKDVREQSSLYRDTCVCVVVVVVVVVGGYHSFFAT